MKQYLKKSYSTKYSNENMKDNERKFKVYFEALKHVGIVKCYIYDSLMLTEIALCKEIYNPQTSCYNDLINDDTEEICAFAKCHPDDKFDMHLGMKIAYNKALKYRETIYNRMNSDRSKSLDKQRLIVADIIDKKIKKEINEEQMDVRNKKRINVITNMGMRMGFDPLETKNDIASIAKAIQEKYESAVDREDTWKSLKYDIQSACRTFVDKGRATPRFIEDLSEFIYDLIKK